MIREQYAIATDNQLAREQKEAAHDDVRISSWCDDDTEVLSERRELLSIRKRGREGGREGERESEREVQQLHDCSCTYTYACSPLFHNFIALTWKW